MTHAVGLRTYQIFVTEKGSSNFIALDDARLTQNFADFLAKFVTNNQQSKDVASAEKSWRLDQRKSESAGNSRGVISYGRYGYAASLLDKTTGQENYKRKKTDSEIYNLYYRFWTPNDEKFCVGAFSSFSGKSCITLVFDAMKEEFEQKNTDFLLKFRRLMPSGASSAVYAGKNVKNLRLVTRTPRSDLADQLFRGKSQKVQRMTVTIHASRNGYLGSFNDLVAGLPSESSSVIQYDGVEFDEAVAMVKIGGEVRPVGVFGAHSEVGVVDITEEITKDSDGLPTYESLDRVSSKIMSAIYKTLNGQSE